MFLSVCVFCQDNITQLIVYAKGVCMQLVCIREIFPPSSKCLQMVWDELSNPFSLSLLILTSLPSTHPPVWEICHPQTCGCMGDPCLSVSSKDVYDQLFTCKIHIYYAIKLSTQNLTSYILFQMANV